MKLSVRLLVAGTGSWTSELLGLAATRISNQQGTVVVDQDVLQLLLGGLIDVCKEDEEINFN